jgi:hypothetical protein
MQVEAGVPEQTCASKGGAARRRDLISAVFSICSMFFGAALFLLGFRCVSTGSRYGGTYENFGNEQIFATLRLPCEVLGVQHELRTESRARIGLDGVERSFPICRDVYRYNFSCGADTATEISGPHRVDRPLQDCQRPYTDEDDIMPASLVSGDQVRCWRLREDIPSSPSPMSSCGQPVCMWTQIYSCSAQGCVQLTDPAEELYPVVASDIVLIFLGGHLMISGLATKFSSIATSLHYERTATRVARLGLVYFCSGLLALLAYASVRVGLPVIAQVEHVYVRTYADYSPRPTDRFVEFIFILLLVTCFFMFIWLPRHHEITLLE